MRILMDLHTHTVASGHAYSTIMENAKAAAEKGLEGIAMTDHGPAMPGGAHLYHFWNLTALPQQIAGVRVLRGVEANIIDSRGGLDVPADILDRLDIVLAGLHGGCIRAGTTADNTRAMLAAMANPWVDIIVHPGNDEFLINPEAVWTCRRIFWTVWILYWQACMAAAFAPGRQRTIRGRCWRRWPIPGWILLCIREMTNFSSTPRRS